MLWQEKLMYVVSGYRPTPYVVHHTGNVTITSLKKKPQKSQILEQSISKKLSSYLSASLIFTLENCHFLLRLQISLHLIIVCPFSPIFYLWKRIFKPLNCLQSWYSVHWCWWRTQARDFLVFLSHPSPHQHQRFTSPLSSFSFPTQMDCLYFENKCCLYKYTQASCSFSSKACFLKSTLSLVFCLHSLIHSFYLRLSENSLPIVLLQ